MSRAVVSSAAILLLRLGNNIQQKLADIANDASVHTLQRPFDIHHSVELRTPDQIMIARNCTIKGRSILNGRSRTKPFGITLGEDSYLKENCYFDAYGGFISTLGRCAFAQNTFIHGGGGVEIGEHVIVGANCCIIASNHVFGNRELPTMLQGDRQKGVQIGNNVWIGGGSIILDGVSIGSNCVVGAGSVVTRPLNDNSIFLNPRNHCIRSIFND